MDKILNILILEDSATDAELVVRQLHNDDIEFTSRQVQTKKDFLEQLRDFSPDLVLADYKLPQFTGLEALELLKEQAPSTPLIIVTGAMTDETAVDCIKAGAADYVIKEHLVRLGPAVKGAMEKKRAEEEKQHAEGELKAAVEKLTVANRELADFAHVAAHDLKAPLRTIGTVAGWLLTDYGGKLDQQGREQLNLLITRTERMNEHINSLLRYSEIGYATEKKEDVNLDSLLKEIITEINVPENIEIVIENELPVVMMGEKVRMRQVLQNLLDNAVKYMDKPQGQIRIDCVEEGDFWKFSIADNGPGIEEEYFEKIFKMFQTLIPRDEFEATGIGLAIVKKIIGMYGGNIWVESQPGQGSTFFFTLPKQEVGAKDATLEVNLAC